MFIIHCFRASSQNSLGGNTRTGMICAVTPASEHTDETLGTLKFATRAKFIKNNAVVRCLCPLCP